MSYPVPVTGLVVYLGIKFFLRVGEKRFKASSCDPTTPYYKMSDLSEMLAI